MSLLDSPQPHGLAPDCAFIGCAASSVAVFAGLILPEKSSRGFGSPVSPEDVTYMHRHTEKEIRDARGNG